MAALKYATELKTNFIEDCFKEHSDIFETLPKTIVNLYKKIFGLDYDIFFERQRLFSVHFLTPYGVFVNELNLAGEQNESDPENRQFFDYLANTDVDFVKMCFVYAECTKMASSIRRKGILAEISDLRQKRQEIIDQLKVTNYGQISNFQFWVPKISKFESRKFKLNDLNFCQYCKFIANNGGTFSRHYAKHRIVEYKKEIQLHVTQVINDIGPSGRSLESEVVRPLPAAPASGVENVTGDVGTSQPSPPATERIQEATPSSGPKTVSANETSSTTIVVRWNEVDLLHRNGIIEGYKVYYGALNVPFRYKKVPNNATFTTTLTELCKFTQYSIQVLAYTRIGDGVLSVPPIVVQTMEDVPGVPSNVSFPDVSFSSARVIWDVPAEPNGEILAYRVTYFIDSTQATNTSKEFSPSDRTYRVTNLEAEQFYMFHIAAKTSLGWGQAAQAVVYTTDSRDASHPPSAPHVSHSQWENGPAGFGPATGLRHSEIEVIYISDDDTAPSASSSGQVEVIDVTDDDTATSASSMDSSELEKEFQKDLQRSWRNDYADSITNSVTIRNLMYDPRYSDGDLVNLTAIVAEVGPKVGFNDNDCIARSQEIQFIDQSADEKLFISLFLWDSVCEVFPMEWKPLSTVIQLTNVKLQVEKNTNQKFLTTTSRTMFTIDPNTFEGYQLTKYANANNPDYELMGDFGQQIQPEQFFRNKAITLGNVAALGDFISQISPGGLEQAVLLDVMIMKFNLDMAISVKCGYCGTRTGYFDLNFKSVPMCINEKCRIEETNDQFYFDFNISIADSTGSMNGLRITGDFAVQTLGQVTPDTFISMSKDDKVELMNWFLFENYEIGIQIEHRANGTKKMNVIHLEPVIFAKS